MTGFPNDMWALLDAEQSGTLLDIAFRRKYIDQLGVLRTLNRLPLICAWYERGSLRGEDANLLLSRWWSYSGYVYWARDRSISRATLVDLFDHAGFVTDDPAVSLSQHPFTIWRDGVPGAQRGLSWSTHFGDAEDFARQRAWTTGCGELWTATIAPLYILGLFNGLQQDEVVIDPSGLGEVFTFARYARNGNARSVGVTYDERYADSMGGE